VAEAAVRETSLVRYLPDDIDRFCPTYALASSNDRVEFWVGLLSAMAKFESDLNPATVFTEKIKDKTGADVVSRGLLQISFESANQRRYACDIEHEESLHDPATNIGCAVRILSTWVGQDGVVAYGDSRRKNMGGARYWSVLRRSRSSLPKIGDITRELRVCQGS
jgi:hypothetical protein